MRRVEKKNRHKAAEPSDVAFLTRENIIVFLAAALAALPAYFLWGARWGLPLARHMLAITVFSLLTHGFSQSFHHGDVNPLIGAIIGCAFFGGIAYGIGALLHYARINRGHVSEPAPQSSQTAKVQSDPHADAVFYGQAAREVYSGDVNVDLMAKAFALTGGNDEASKAKYIELRAQQLKAQ